MNAAQRNKVGRLICDHVLSDGEYAKACDQAFKEQFGDGCKDGSIHQQAFLTSLYAGLKRLETLGQLELFRKTCQLPDYSRAEDAVRRGWGHFMELEFGITSDKAKDKLRIRQCQLLDAVRGASTHGARTRILRDFWKVCAGSAKWGDTGFFRKLGHALGDAPRSKEGINDFAQVLLNNWLTSFWWLMPLKAVAQDMARIQGKPDDAKMITSFNTRLRQIRSRKVESRPGAFFSAGWNGCFYSTSPPLIDYIERDGRPVINAVGRGVLV
jgi:hypothetical protein